MRHLRRTFATHTRRLEDVHNPNSKLPRVASTTFWSSLAPKPFRRPTNAAEAAERAQARAERPSFWASPYSTFAFLGLLVGSNAIQIIGLRNDIANFNRKTDAKITALREVIQKLRSGQDVDVKGFLSTDDTAAEVEWDQFVRDLEKMPDRKRDEKRSSEEGTDGGRLGRETADRKRNEKMSEPGRPDNDQPKPKFLM
ncbi:hypothetical protein K470DRAFT_250029 [Piedraia hortae CBS 480.64]|uniref:Uncharacterized protein n=1 Tax=Piedraia hortae CBS 480.64 TaxID=1314780 RepID=A0A6A7BX11_9PEZI|nr:hypothetical protein K470DRAFT_250029 [Piedraia hortae CBS 480.64]